MIRTLGRVATLLVSVAILLIGHGLQLTLLPVRAGYLGWDASLVALTGSAYFLGFVVGCLVIPSTVSRVAHIRTFMVMGALATLFLLGAGLLNNPYAWLFLRFGTGFAFSGLYMVIESWLGEASPKESRGSVLATYTMICLLGMTAGQGLLALGSPGDLTLIAIGAVFLCLAIIPIGLTSMPAPAPIPRTRFSAKTLLRASRVAVVCAFMGGLITGAIWAIGPLVGDAFQLSGAQIGLMMGAIILGGAVAQLPVGRLSDRTDRRMVIGGLLATGAAVSLLSWVIAGSGNGVLYLCMFSVGACSMPIYALCIANASDNSEVPLIEIASGILIMNSLGSIIGPLIASLMLASFGGPAFFLYTAVCFTLASTWAFYRLSVVERPHEHATGRILPKTTPVIAGLHTDEPTEDDSRK